MRINLITKCIKLFLTMLTIVWVFITLTEFLINYNNNNKSKHRLRPNGSRSLIKQIQQNDKYFIILFWTKYFSRSIESYNNYSLKSSKCKLSNCLVTSDRAYLPFSNALLFHWRDLNIFDMPSIRHWDQLWTLYNLEAPTYTTSQSIHTYNNNFNITSSYRTDSDIYIPYGRIVKRNKTINNYINQIDFNNKTKLIVWFVSNCVTPGRRESYAQELNKFIKIDVHGNCGQFICEPHRSQYCFQKVAKNYKFYLAFENSICRDYVTEKLFEALNYDILPIVFGGSDYKSFLPSRSFIDATKLTPKQLAKHLIEIASNEQKYLSYFKWKENYSVESGLDSKFEVFCKLCQILNSHKTYSSHSSDQLIEWWFHKSKCMTWTINGLIIS